MSCSALSSSLIPFHTLSLALSINITAPVAAREILCLARASLQSLCVSPMNFVSLSFLHSFAHSLLSLLLTEKANRRKWKKTREREVFDCWMQWATNAAMDTGSGRLFTIQEFFSSHVFLLSLFFFFSLTHFRTLFLFPIFMRCICYFFRNSSTNT